jgi:hypothetical protein
LDGVNQDNRVRVERDIDNNPRFACEDMN